MRFFIAPVFIFFLSTSSVAASSSTFDVGTLEGGARQLRPEIWDQNIRDQVTLESLCAPYDSLLYGVQRLRRRAGDYPCDWVRNLWSDFQRKRLPADAEPMMKRAQEIRTLLTKFAGQDAVDIYELGMPYSTDLGRHHLYRGQDFESLMEGAKTKSGTDWTSQIPDERSLSGLCLMYTYALGRISDSVHFVPENKKRWVSEILSQSSNSSDTAVSSYLKTARKCREMLLNYAGEDAVAKYELSIVYPVSSPAIDS